MKKWGIVLFSSLLVFVLAACNSSAEPKEGSNNNSELTLEEVYQKAIERQNELESVTAAVKMDQVMNFGAGEESLEISSKSDMTMDMITDPLSVYMKGTMDMGEPEAAQETMINMEMYMTETGLYMHDSLSNQWNKLPTDDLDVVIGQTANQVNAAEQLEQMKAFIEDFKFEQTDSTYVLTLDASSEKFNEYMLEQLQITETLGVPEESEQLLSNTKFEKVNYVIVIDKDTFDISEMDTNVVLTMDIEGDIISIDSDTAITFNNFNGVEEISIPHEVIDTAVEVQY